MLACQAHLDAVTVDSEVLLSELTSTVAPLLDVTHAAVGTHGRGGEVRVHPSAVPVSRYGLGVEGGCDAVALTDAVEQPTSDPQVVAGAEAPAGRATDLKLPLAGHDLSVDSSQMDPSTGAHLHVFLDQFASLDLVGTYAAVVRPLSSREPAVVAEAEGA